MASALRQDPIVTHPVDPESVFSALERDRKQGRLGAEVTRAPVYYEASRLYPGYLDRVHPDGNREVGWFHNGEFVPLMPATDRPAAGAGL